MKNKVVVVDDDQQFTTLVTEYLKGRGYDAAGYFCYVDAVKRINDSVELVILDIYLGDGDGLALMSELIARFPNQKHIILTGIDSLPKRLQSFAKGAEDYMKKPIFPSELEARVKRILSRVNSDSAKSIIPNEKMYTSSEKKIIEQLFNARGEIVPMDALKKNANETEVAIYTTISRLKKKILGKFTIKSSYGRGWYISNSS